MHATYRQEGSAGQPSVVSWGALGRDTQARLMAACQGEGAVPLLTALAPLPRSPVGLIGLALVAAGSAAALLARGYGEVGPEPLAESTAGRTAVLALVALSGASAALAARAWVLRGALPFPAGVFLFANELVEARRSTLRLVPTSQLMSVVFVERAGQGEVQLQFAGGERYAFSCDAEAAQGLQTQLAQLRGSLEQAQESGDMATVERLDPLWAERPRWQAQGAPSIAPTRWPRWLWSPAPVLLVASYLGSMLGLGLPLLVQRGSERSALEKALQARDVGALWSLARRRGPAADKADEALLQMALGDPDATALERYMRGGGLRPQVADDALFKRASEGGAAALRRYLDNGGRRREEADELLFQEVTRLPPGGYLGDGEPRCGESSEPGRPPSPDKKRPGFDLAARRQALESYALHGRRADEVRSLHLPRLRIAQASRQCDPAELWKISTDAHPTIQAEARAAVQALYGRARRAGRGALGGDLDALLAYLSEGDRDLQLLASGRAEGDLGDSLEPGALDELLIARVRSRLGHLVGLGLLRLRSSAHERVVIPLPSSAYLRVSYEARPAGAGTSLEGAITVHLPGRASDPSTPLRFRSVRADHDGLPRFVDDLNAALAAALGER